MKRDKFGKKLAEKLNGSYIDGKILITKRNSPIITLQLHLDKYSRKYIKFYIKYLTSHLD